jgi:hypothetical protein
MYRWRELQYGIDIARGWQAGDQLLVEVRRYLRGRREDVRGVP